MTSSWSPDVPDDGHDAAAVRPPYRPPIGIPVPKERRLVGTLVSVALHLLVILLLLAPVYGPKVLEEVQGAGGEGPAGGGGGGTRGTGGNSGAGVVERLHYIQVAPPPPAPQPVAPPEVKKPEPTPTPPVVPPVAKPATPEPAAADVVGATAPVPGTGGGTGADGSAGSGPGSGGGVGSGIGTGRGAGEGPGTGGGNASIHPPQPKELFLPPWPVPDKVKGTQMVAVFDVDSLGRVVSFEFTPTRDGGYNRKLHDVLAAVKFRPATRADGQPVRAKGSLRYDF